MDRIFTIFATLLAFAAVTAHADRTYKWVDENGVTHYGDAVPAKYTKSERYVLNDQGVMVKTLPRQKTQEELEEEARRLAQLEEERLAAARQAERDRVLLDTYLSLDEIAMLRDRRILALDAQIGVTRHYLKNLQTTWEELEAESRNYNFPYTEESKLPPLPEDLAQHLIHTEKSMAEHMRVVQALRRDQDGIRAQFAQDMERFKELNANLDGR